MARMNMKRETRHRAPVETEYPLPKGKVFTVREAKAGLSGLIRLAAQGMEVTITSHGRPKARIAAASPAGVPFRVDRQWLNSTPVAKPRARSERIVRREREGRG